MDARHLRSAAPRRLKAHIGEGDAAWLCGGGCWGRAGLVSGGAGERRNGDARAAERWKVQPCRPRDMRGSLPRYRGATTFLRWHHLVTACALPARNVRDA